MGLRSEIQTDLAEAFDTDLADAVRSLTYRSLIQGDNYDPAQGKNTPSFTAYLDCRCVFDKLETDKIINSSTNTTTAEVIILQNELVPVPKTNDVIWVGTEEWVVGDVAEDPASATWVLNCSKNAEEIDPSLHLEPFPITGPVTLETGYLYVATGAGAFDVAIPPSGNEFFCAVQNNSADAITFSKEFSDTVNGIQALPFLGVGQTATIQYDTGNNYLVVIDG